MPWECPRCRTIHSDMVGSCYCPPPIGTSTAGTETNHAAAIPAIDTALTDAAKQKREAREASERRAAALHMIRDLREYARVYGGLKDWWRDDEIAELNRHWWRDDQTRLKKR